MSIKYTSLVTGDERILLYLLDVPYQKSELKELGFKDIEHFQSILDGKTKTWEWIPSYQWEINSGELWLYEPDKEKLCDFNEIPVNIITHSKSCDIITEVVDVGTGTTNEELEANDITGKFILMNGGLV